MNTSQVTAKTERVKFTSDHYPNDVAQRAGEMIYELRAKHGAVTAEMFCTRVKKEPRGSPIHSYFDHWDLRASAEKRWLDVSRHLLRSVYEITIEKGEPVHRRVAYFVPEADGYMVRDDIQRSESAGLSLLNLAKKEAEAYYLRYSSILKLTGNARDPKLTNVLNAIKKNVIDK